jgi:DNA-directed RNA polymerase subunit H (RpoH/RPB5)
MFWTEIGNFSKNHEENILHHVNVEAIQLLENSELCEILKEYLSFWCNYN